MFCRYEENVCALKEALGHGKSVPYLPLPALSERIGAGAAKPPPSGATMRTPNILVPIPITIAAASET